MFEKIIFISYQERAIQEKIRKDKTGRRKTRQEEKRREIKVSTYEANVTHIHEFSSEAVPSSLLPVAPEVKCKNQDQKYNSTCHRKTNFQGAAHA